MVTITPNLSAFATDNLLIKERVYHQLLTYGWTPTASKGRTFFRWEVDRAIHDIRKVVAQESLAQPHSTVPVIALPHPDDAPS